MGFGDLTPRTPYGRAFAVFFMMVSVGIVLYALTSTVQAIVHSELFASYGTHENEQNARPFYHLWRRPSRIAFVSIRRDDGEIIFNPSGSTQIEGGDMLIAIGNAESLARLNALARGRATTVEVKS